jgi:hypothetical protein
VLSAVSPAWNVRYSRCARAVTSACWAPLERTLSGGRTTTAAGRATFFAGCDGTRTASWPV